MHYLTATQAASRLGKSEKTIRRWIKEGRLHAHHPQGRPNMLAIAEDDIEQIATDLAQYEQEQSSNQDGALLERVQQLEQRTAHIERLLSGESKPRKPRATSAIEQPASIPSGSLTYGDFARKHGVPDRTFLDHIRTGKVVATEIDKPHRPGEKVRYLSPEQQRAALDFWTTNGTRYTLCPECPHKQDQSTSSEQAEQE